MIRKIQKLLKEKEGELFAVNCSSLKEAEELLKDLGKMGYCWYDDSVPVTDENGELSRTEFDAEKGSTAYYFCNSFPVLLHSRKQFFKKNCVEVIEFSSIKNNAALEYKCDLNKVTYVEIFDKNAIKNICSALAQAPKKIILVGTNADEMKKACKTYLRILGGGEIQIECKAYKNRIPDIVNALSDIVETEEECCFDITGGSDTFLVALGTVFEKYRNRNVQIHRFNIEEQTITDCDDDGVTPFRKFPALSVEDNICIYGGKVVSESITGAEEINTEELDKLWAIFRKHTPTEWNSAIMILMNVTSRCIVRNGDSHYYRIDSTDEKFSAFMKNGILHEFIAKKIFKRYVVTSYYIIFEFCDAFVEKCLATSGNLLETKIFSLAVSAKESDGATPFFHDVKSGVKMEWEYEHKNNTPTVDNEIDVMAMDGVVPVFISCKNGKFNQEELYKLSTVANNFGGEYAKKVIVTNDALSERGNINLKERALEMGIKTIVNVNKKSDAQIVSELKKYDIIQ